MEDLLLVWCLAWGVYLIVRRIWVGTNEGN